MNRQALPMMTMDELLGVVARGLQAGECDACYEDRCDPTWCECSCHTGHALARERAQEALAEIRRRHSEEGRGEEAEAEEVKALRQELAEVLRVALARGEELGYEDADYWKRLFELEEDSRVCVWRDQFDYWETACGNTFVLSDGDSPEAHEMKFCPYCGRPLLAGG